VGREVLTVLSRRDQGVESNSAADLDSDAPTLVDGDSPTVVEAVSVSVSALAADRQRLVNLCIEAADVLGTGALHQRLIDALAESGVTAVEVPAETPFDPTLHKATDRRMTEREHLVGLVAETERAGFVDHGQRLRWPEVVVYQLDAGRRDGD
jgi:hypothetical protein